MSASLRIPSLKNESTVHALPVSDSSLDAQSLRLSLAPMEGVTGFVYRNAYHRHYRPMERYYTPFLSPTGEGNLSTREKNDVLPAHNEGMHVVPQILTNRPEQLLRVAAYLRELGYEEVNLNLGCPAPTVVTKHKGAAMLAEPATLNAFLDKVCTGLASIGMRLSIKTRLGMEQPEQFETLLPIFNRYPLTELILHPRVRSDFYTGKPRLCWYQYAVQHSVHPLCYNGDVNGLRSYQEVRTAIQAARTAKAAQTAKEAQMAKTLHPVSTALAPLVTTVPQAEANPKEQLSLMLGRGLLSAPWLAEDLSGAPDLPVRSEAAEKERLQAFHQDLYEGYRRLMSGEQPALFKMKEVWTYLIRPFDGGDTLLKKLKKTKTAAQYEATVQTIFRELPLTINYCRTL